MKTMIVEASNAFNWGKFLVGEFDVEWLRHPQFPHDQAEYLRLGGRLPQLLDAVGWTQQHRLVLDLQTGEGGIFYVTPSGYPEADLEKHKVWVCPLFEPFLGWLYQQPRKGMGLGLDLDKLPATVRLPDAPLALSGYRRQGHPGVEPEQAQEAVRIAREAAGIMDAVHSEEGERT